MIGHLYVHIPFCPKLCPYCSFYSEVGDGNKTQRFLDALLRELAGYIQEMPLQPRTIFFGGGTPSALSVRQLEHLLRGMRDLLDLSSLHEWTLEMNPATVSVEKARVLRDLGVNRISMGVQSWDPALLQTLGRIHSSEQAERSYEILRAAGFENVNLDLMFAIPGQSKAQWLASLQKTISLQPNHISAYSLTYEEDTAFFQRLQAGEFAEDEDLDADLFELAMETLGSAGFVQYEISNYARPGRECAHNLGYWQGSDYLGIGPSAFSTVGTQRWQNVCDAEEYTRRLFSGDSPQSGTEALTPEVRRSEMLAFSLRTNRGIQAGLAEPWSDQLAEFESLGLLASEGGSLILTTAGKLLADSIAEVFV